MATQKDITLLIKTGLKGKNDKPKPDRYNIYLLLKKSDRWGVVTRSGIFQEDGTPKLSLISGKFHYTEEKARAAYDALVKKQRASDNVKDGTYTYNPDPTVQWQALTESVEKRQRALEARRAKKNPEEAGRPGIIQIEDPHLFDKQQTEQEEQPAEKPDPVEEEEQQPAEKPVPIEKPDDDLPALQQKPEKKTAGRRLKVPANFQSEDKQDSRIEAWQALKPRERTAWKKANPIV